MVLVVLVVAKIFVVPMVAVILVMAMDIMAVGTPTNILIVVVPIIPLIFTRIYMVDSLVLHSLASPLAWAFMLSLTWSLLPTMSTVPSSHSSGLVHLL